MFLHFILHHLYFILSEVPSYYCSETMIANDFYSIIDQEIEALLEKFQNDSYLLSHADKNNQKPYGLLIWFLEFYGRVLSYAPYITDGRDDSSCDIILDMKDGLGRVFYVVQAKWNAKTKVSSNKDLKDDILKSLSDFETVLRGDRKTLNEKVQKRLEDLSRHLQENGEVRFIFLTLSEYKGSADENIESFNKAHEKTTFEVIDITRLKTDYIDKHYKQILPDTPLRRYQDPAKEMVTLHIERFGGQKGNYMYVGAPFPSYTFFVRPKLLYDLFERYNFALFDKNIRNPLLQSQFNENIEKTALENPAYFWYYNNGITGITDLLPTVREEATTIEIGGLQIINGAQTLYSVYRAYKNASPMQRSVMDTVGFISLRLLNSGSKDFDFNVTRFTNSQNPVTERDFWANDEIQIRLQQEFYETKMWYEKRRGEFREVPKNIAVIPNDIAANAYLSFYLQDPISLIANFRDNPRKNLCFVSHKELPNGLYEKIFNNETQAKDIEAALYLSSLFFTLAEIEMSIDDLRSGINHKDYGKYLMVNYALGLCHTVLKKYLGLKYKAENIDVSNYITDAFRKEDPDKSLFFIQLYDFVDISGLHVLDTITSSNSEEFFTKIFTKYGGFERFAEELAQRLTTVDDIESRDITRYLPMLSKATSSFIQPKA